MRKLEVSHLEKTDSYTREQFCLELELTWAYVFIVTQQCEAVSAINK